MRPRGSTCTTTSRRRWRPSGRRGADSRNSPYSEASPCQGSPRRGEAARRGSAHFLPPKKFCPGRGAEHGRRISRPSVARVALAEGRRCETPIPGVGWSPRLQDAPGCVRAPRRRPGTPALLSARRRAPVWSPSPPWRAPSYRLRLAVAGCGNQRLHKCSLFLCETPACTALPTTRLEGRTT
jgi:hypothetical protein